MLSLAFLRNDFFMGAGTLVDGNVFVNKNASIAGTINGDLRSTGKITIQKTAVINGDVAARSVVVRGLVKGNICCEDKIYVQQQASVQGNIIAAEAVIDKNSSIKGTISKPAADEPKQESTEVNDTIISTTPETPEIMVEEKIPPSSWF